MSKGESGFTLVEVLLSILILGLVTVTLSNVYFAGFNAVDARITEGLLDSAMRSRMEVLLAQKFDALSNGSEVIDVQGDSYTVSWTIGGIDLDEDTVDETDAKEITVAVADKSLSTIVVDLSDQVGEI